MLALKDSSAALSTSTHPPPLVTCTQTEEFFRERAKAQTEELVVVPAVRTMSKRQKVPAAACMERCGVAPIFTVIVLLVQGRIASYINLIYKYTTLLLMSALYINKCTD